MSARANWFVEGEIPTESENDPFEAPIEEVGERIDLRDPDAVLNLRLIELLRREAALFERGIECPIKEMRDTSCHACSVSRAHDREDPMGILCRLGREQDTTLTELAVLRCRDK